MQHQPESPQDHIDRILMAIAAALLLDIESSIAHCYPDALDQEELDHRLLLYELIGRVLQDLPHHGAVDTFPAAQRDRAWQLSIQLAGLAQLCPEELLRRAAAHLASVQSDPLHSLFEQLQAIAIDRCRHPYPEDLDSLLRAPRSLYILDKYVQLLCRIVNHELRSAAPYQRHPILPLIVNLQDRINRCFNELSAIKSLTKCRSTVSRMFTALREGDVDEFQAVPEYTAKRLSAAQAAIEDTYLALGRREFQLTWPEETFIAFLSDSTESHRREVARTWSAVMERAASRSDGHRPRYDKDSRRLLLGSTVLKEFKKPAPDQTTILEAFEEDGWPERIASPLPDGKLSTTVKNLTRSIGGPIRFRLDGTGEGVCWEAGTP